MNVDANVKHYKLDEYLTHLTMNDSIYGEKAASLLSYLGGVLPSNDDLINDEAMYHYNCKTFLVGSDQNHYLIKEYESQSIVFKLPKVRVNGEYPDVEMISYMLNTVSKFHHEMSPKKNKIKSYISFFNDKNCVFDTSIYYKYRSNFFLFMPENYYEDDHYKKIKNEIYNIKNVLYSREFLNCQMRIALNSIKSYIKNNKGKTNNNKKGLISSFFNRGTSVDSYVKDAKKATGVIKLHMEDVDSVYNNVSENINIMFFSLINNSNIYNIDFLTKLYFSVYSYYYNKKDFANYIIDFIITKNLTNIFVGYSKRLFYRESNLNKIRISADDFLNSVDTYIVIALSVIENMFKTLRYYFVNKSFGEIERTFLSYYPVLTISDSKNVKNFDLYNDFVKYMNSVLNTDIDLNLNEEDMRFIFDMIKDKDHLDILKQYMLNKRLAHTGLDENIIKKLIIFREKDEKDYKINADRLEKFIQMKKIFLNAYNLEQTKNYKRYED